MARALASPGVKVAPPAQPAASGQSEEWTGFHLPCTFRVDYRTFLYTRCTVPIDREQSRMFYFHTTRPGSRWRRGVDTLVFYLWRNWQMNYNFSGQDRAMMESQRYDTPEKLSGTDLFPLETRRLIAQHARDFQPRRQDGSRSPRQTP